MGIYLKYISISTSIFLTIYPNSVLAVQKLSNPRFPNPYLVAEGGLSENLKDFDYWLDLCDLQFQSGKYDKALTACEKAITVKPKNPVAWAKHSGILLKSKQYPDAIASASKSLKLNENNSLALTYKCMAFEALDKNDTALDNCNQALKVDGNWGKQSPKLAWRHRGVILAKTSKYELAQNAFARTLLIEPKDSLTLAYRCQIENKLGKFKQAISSCDKALNGNRDWGDKNKTFALSNRAEANTRLNQLEQAIADYDQLLAVNPKDAVAWGAQGILLEKLGKYTEALTSYDQAIAIEANYSLALVGRAAVLNKNKQYEEALKASEAALKGDGNWQVMGVAQAWNEKGVALIGKGEYKAALAATNRAVGIQSFYPEAWNNRGVALWHLQDYLEASASTQKAIALNPRYAQALLNQARIFSKRGLYRQALRFSHKALSIEPLNYEGWINRGVTLWHLKRYKEALNSVDKAIAIDYKAFEAWYNRGLILTSMYQYKKAFKAYQQARKINPKSAAAITGQGIILTKLKYYPKAIAAFKESLKLNPEDRVAKGNLKKVIKLQQEE